MEEIIDAAYTVHKQGVKNVIVSMGAEGALLIGERKRYLASPPKVKVKNTVGAGDSAVAGFIYGLVSGKDLKDCLVYAVAAGTATTLMPGTAVCKKDDFIKLIPEIKLEVLEDG